MSLLPPRYNIKVALFQDLSNDNIVIKHWMDVSDIKNTVSAAGMLMFIQYIENHPEHTPFLQVMLNTSLEAPSTLLSVTHIQSCHTLFLLLT